MFKKNKILRYSYYISTGIFLAEVFLIPVIKRKRMPQPQQQQDQKQ